MQKIVTFHIDEYGDEPEACAAAPGRFHLLGEHTWFAQGNTLSMAINHYLYVCASRRSDNNFRLFSISLNERKKISSSGLRYKKEDRWANSVKAVIAAFIDSGYPISGLNFTILSEIPSDAGLGTPNALKTAVALILRKLFAPKLSKNDLVDILEHANTQHLNTYPHRADILCALFAKANHCVRTDHRKKTAEIYPFPIEGHSIILTDSRVPRIIAREELGARLDECIDAYELVKKQPDMPKDMSQLTEKMLEELDIPESVRRRVTYIIRESLSVDDAVDSLKRNDNVMLSRILNRSHEGLRDRFEISCPELDWIVKRSLEFIEPSSTNVVCARMTGKGFGGCTYTIISEKDALTYTEKLDDYERIFGFKPLLYKARPTGCARIF
ncbi:galactokinase [Treponema pedis]|nr:galactokinase [Treponema pedis]QOW61952.1 galactokinase [Treponema pedis]QSI04872.1 galactokinase [Treponema pedis]